MCQVVRYFALQRPVPRAERHTVNAGFDHTRLTSAALRSSDHIATALKVC